MTDKQRWLVTVTATANIEETVEIEAETEEEAINDAIAKIEKYGPSSDPNEWSAEVGSSPELL